MSRSATRAAGLAAGAFALVTFVWRAVPPALYYLPHGHFPAPREPSPWDVFVGNASPDAAYFSLVKQWSGVIVVSERPMLWTAQYRDMAVDAAVAPAYLQPEAVAAVAALWGVAPLLVGAWWFGRSDLR